MAMAMPLLARAKPDEAQAKVVEAMKGPTPMRAAAAATIGLLPKTADTPKQLKALEYDSASRGARRGGALAAGARARGAAALDQGGQGRRRRRREGGGRDHRRAGEQARRVAGGGGAGVDRQGRAAVDAQGGDRRARAAGRGQAGRWRRARSGGWCTTRWPTCAPMRRVRSATCSRTAARKRSRR